MTPISFSCIHPFIDHEDSQPLHLSSKLVSFQGAAELVRRSRVIASHGRGPGIESQLVTLNLRRALGGTSPTWASARKSLVGAEGIRLR